MPKPDYAHQVTDKELAALEKRIASVYKQAAKDMQDKVTAYFEAFAKRDEAEKAKLEAGEITEQQYKQWRLAQIGRGERFEDMRDKLAQRMTKANEVAADYVNDATPGIYSLNRNYAAYTIEKVSGNVGFTLWDEKTVKRLIKDQPNLMPSYPKQLAVKRGIDLAWGKKQITKQVTSGILQGESIKKLADRLQKNIPTMNRDSAIRSARTAVTGAQNAGRMDSYEDAKDIGIELKKKWMATLDGRTRYAHAMLDGQVAETDEPFKSELGDIMFPGDPSAHPANVYNCRCTMVAELPDVDLSNTKRRAIDPETGESVLIENMTYSEWAGWKESLQDYTKSVTINTEVSPIIFKQFRDGDQVNDFFYYDGDERGIKARKSSLHGQWLGGLSQDERSAISWYTADGYGDINDYWRKRDGWESISADIVKDASEKIDTAISAFTLKDNITVQRGVEEFYGASLVELKEWNDISEIVGMTFRDRGYGSATALIGNSVATAKPYLFEIDIPAGTGRGAYINKLAGQYEDKEYEFLIARDSKFEITEVVINTEPIPQQTIIKMRMIVDG